MNVQIPMRRAAEIKLRNGMMKLAHAENRACGLLDPRRERRPAPKAKPKPRGPYKPRTIPNAPAGACRAAIEALDLSVWTPTKEIAHQAGASASSTRKALDRMERDGALVTETRHIGRALTRFWRAA